MESRARFDILTAFGGSSLGRRPATGEANGRTICILYTYSEALKIRSSMSVVRQMWRSDLLPIMLAQFVQLVIENLWSFCILSPTRTNMRHSAGSVIIKRRKGRGS